MGYYRDSSANNHGYIFDVFTREFTYIDIPAPGAYGTRVYDINNNGLLVGGYLDSSNFHYGFTATIVPVPAALLLFGSGLAGLFGMATLRRGRARRA